MENEKPKKKRNKGAGRPFKVKIWVDKLREVLEENNVVFLTDLELLFLVNSKIEDKDCRITDRTLKNWKAGKLPSDNTIADEFIELITSALIKQKAALFEKFEAAQNMSWTKYAWIIERKFNEWNLKQISEVKNTNEQKNVIHITASSEQQKQLIDNIIDADFIVAEPLKLELPLNDNKSDEDEF